MTRFCNPQLTLSLQWRADHYFERRNSKPLNAFLIVDSSSSNRIRTFPNTKKVTFRKEVDNTVCCCFRIDCSSANPIFLKKIQNFPQTCFDNCILFSTFQSDEDYPHAFTQVFVLKPLGNSFFCAHDIFRLNIHDTA